ncbi:hypothetical protein ABT104_06195 [Streptomyces mobaraensis]|uniref:hypothetical protein n=1 Tax=Streptomyces mobaraensis TaxID=35621 RepID=UPI0033250DA3
MIEDILRGLQIRTPAYTSDERAADDRLLRARIDHLERRRAGARHAPAADWLVPTSPEIADLVLQTCDDHCPARLQALKDRLREDLETLCEQVARAPRTAARLIEFAEAERPTDPVGARGLACLLHLAGNDVGARFWWRYAAGADDATSAYCLFLDCLLHDRPVEAVHCYRELGAGGFLCDEDWETTTDSAVPTQVTWPRDVEKHIRDVNTVDQHGPVPIPEGYLENVSQAERDELLCHR